MEQIQEAIISGVIGIIVALIGVLATGVRQYFVAKAEEMKATKSDTEWAMLQSIALTVVTAVEQIAKTVDLKPKQKYAQAIEMLNIELSERGIKLTEAQKQTLIESGVKALDQLEYTVIETVTQ